MIWIIIAAVVVLFFVLRMKGAKGVNQMTAADLKEQLKKKPANTIYLDVRTPAEYKSRHIKEFKNMPLGSNYSTLDSSKKVVVICQSGMRSMQACKQLKKLGFSDITNVRGGMSAWR